MLIVDQTLGTDSLLTSRVADGLSASDSLFKPAFVNEGLFTQAQRGDIVPVEISVYEDRTFTFITKTPQAARMILKAAGVEKGSPTPHKTKVATITRDQAREIAQTKMQDLNANDIEAATEIIAGTARSMGINVSGS